MRQVPVRLRRVFAGLLLVALAVVEAFAQATEGSLRGSIRDEQGAPMPGVTVTAKSSAATRPLVVVTDETGAYRLLNVAPGDYVAITVRARAASLDPRLEEAARDLGASAVGAFRHVTLPLLAPAIAAGAMLALALSFDDLVVTSFNTGVGSTTLPVQIYSAIRFGVTPSVNAISTIIVAVVSIALLIAWRLGAFRTAARAVVADPEVA